MSPNVPGPHACSQRSCNYPAEINRGSCCMRCHDTNGDRHGRNCTGANYQEQHQPRSIAPQHQPRSISPAASALEHPPQRTSRNASIARLTIGASRQSQAENHVRTHSPTQDQHIIENTSTGSVCVICHNSQPIFAFRACGHLALCEACHTTVLDTAEPRCPICRIAVVISPDMPPFLRIYFPGLPA